MGDNQLIAVIENALLTPSSDFYISTILRNPNGKALDPRTIDEVNLGTFSVEGVEIGITLKSLTVLGLSNVQVKFKGGEPDITVVGDVVTFHVALPNEQPGYVRPSDVPAQVEAAGELDVTLAGQAMPPGGLTLRLASIEDLTGVFAVTETRDDDLSTLEVTVTAVTVNPRLSPGDMVIEVKLDTVFAPTINAVLNRPDSQKKLVAELNKQLAEPAILAELSKQATAQARKAFGPGL